MSVSTEKDGSGPAGVCIVSHLFPNREQPLYGVFVREGARALARYRPVSVVAPVSHFPVLRPRRTVPARDDAPAFPIVHPRYLALPRFLFAQRWRTYGAALQRGLSAIRQDAALLHAHWVYPDAYAAARLCRRTGQKLVITVHGHRTITATAAERRFVQQPLSAADQIITVSEELRAKLIATYGVSPEKISLVRNGYDPEKFGVKSRQEARVTLGIPADRPVAITVARLSPEKALDVLIRATRHASREDLLLYLIGDGPLKAELRRLIDAEGLAQRITLVGGVPHGDLNTWFSAADFFCLPSHTEGCPVVIHEAFACGIPVVASSVGAIPELIDSPALGVLCAPGDIDALAAALDRAAGTAWSQQAIADYGRRFTWNAAAQQTSAIYDEVLGR
jgi:glycosyltransferase involved in cell wall biosynthesis